MTDDKNRRQILFDIGASDSDIDALLEYTKNAFQSKPEQQPDEELSPSWQAMLERINDTCKNTPVIEMFPSVAGKIPIVYPKDTGDFERILREIVYKGKDVPNLQNMGASFVSGKTLRFIVLSDKPYSGIPAEEMGLPDSCWATKSLIIRKYHECAHYYTKRFLGSSRNNLHDELIADFCGIYAAFGEYHAKYFIAFFSNRLELYTKGLSAEAAGIIYKIADKAAFEIEAWTKTPEFEKLSDAQRIDYLAGRELLAYFDK